MQRKTFWSILMAIVFAAMLALCGANSSLVPVQTPDGQETSGGDAVISLAVVSCGDRVPETLTLLKSALMFTKSKLSFYIITEANLKHLFIEQVTWIRYF